MLSLNNNSSYLINITYRYYMNILLCADDLFVKVRFRLCSRRRLGAGVSEVTVMLRQLESLRSGVGFSSNTRERVTLLQ